MAAVELRVECSSLQTQRCLARARAMLNPPRQLDSPRYRGRLAPSPTGYLHLGHARTFWIAARRSHEARGTLLLRSDDLDRARCQVDFVDAMQEDLRWLGLEWSGPMIQQSD